VGRLEDELMVQRYEGHERVVSLPRGRKVVNVPAARMWTAEDYDLIEELIAQGLRYSEMLPYFTDPPVTRNALQKACENAGIEYRHKPGRPRKRADHGS
jgi:hypothetical protein